MGGCGENCRCGRKPNPNEPGVGGCDGSCSTKTRRSNTLSDALAKVIIDNWLVRFTVDALRTYPELTAEDIIAMANDAKTAGEL